MKLSRLAPHSSPAPPHSPQRVLAGFSALSLGTQGLYWDVPKHLGLVEMLGAALPIPTLCSGVIAGWLQ